LKTIKSTNECVQFSTHPLSPSVSWHNAGPYLEMPYNNNNNSNPRTIFIVLSSWPLKVIVRVHSVHLMNAAQRTSGCRPSDQATWLVLWVRL